MDFTLFSFPGCAQRHLALELLNIHRILIEYMWMFVLFAREPQHRVDCNHCRLLFRSIGNLIWAYTLNVRIQTQTCIRYNTFRYSASFLHHQVERYVVHLDIQRNECGRSPPVHLAPDHQNALAIRIHEINHFQHRITKAMRRLPGFTSFSDLQLIKIKHFENICAEFPRRTYALDIHSRLSYVPNGIQLKYCGFAELFTYLAFMCKKCPDFFDVERFECKVRRNLLMCYNSRVDKLAKIEGDGHEMCFG